MKAFVAGATGATGQRIVRELVQRQIPVRALVRDLATAKTLLPPEVTLIQGGLVNTAALVEAIGDSDVLLCATGARPSLTEPMGPMMVDYWGVANLTDAAKQAHIQHFVLVSSLCVSRFFHPLNLFWLVLAWKLYGENYLRQSGLTYTIVRPGGLLNDNPPGQVVMAPADTLFQGRIPRSQVAEVCVEALSCPAARQKVVEIVSRSEAPALGWTELFSQV
jgi:uncharacterized protein YbjT (DUF2867 family)